MNMMMLSLLPMLIASPLRTEPGCSVQGTGGLKTYLKVNIKSYSYCFFLQIAQSQINAQINLAASPGTWGSCGVKYDPKTEERRVAIGKTPFYQTWQTMRLSFF